MVYKIILRLARAREEIRYIICGVYVNRLIQTPWGTSELFLLLIQLKLKLYYWQASIRLFLARNALRATLFTRNIECSRWLSTRRIT